MNWARKNLMGAIEKPKKAKAEKLPKGIRKVASGRYQVRYTGPDGQRYAGVLWFPGIAGRVALTGSATSDPQSSHRSTRAFSSSRHGPKE